MPPFVERRKKWIILEISMRVILKKWKIKNNLIVDSGI
jgi:hypothetical protein